MTCKKKAYSLSRLDAGFGASMHADSQRFSKCAPFEWNVVRKLECKRSGMHNRRTKAAVSIFPRRVCSPNSQRVNMLCKQ